MKQLLNVGTLYLKKMDLTDMALLKFCMTALGVLIGLGAAKHHKRSAGILAGIVLVSTWLPLMGKLLGLAAGETED